MDWKKTKANDRFYNHKHKDPAKTNRQAIIRLSHHIADVSEAIKENESFFATWMAKLVEAFAEKPEKTLARHEYEDGFSPAKIALTAGAVH